MNPGNRQAHVGLLSLLLVLTAAQAGRPGEDGSGAMWIAPELLPRQVFVEACTHASLPATGELVFEMIRFDGTPDLEHLMSVVRRPVRFEWNASSGELQIQGTSTDGIFADLGVPADERAPSLAGSCGSGGSAVPADG